MMKKSSVILILFPVLLLTACSPLATVESENGSKEDKPLCSANDLEDNHAYVWHHENGDIKEDLDEGAESEVFFALPQGTYNFVGDELDDLYLHEHTIWFEGDLDEEIPTVGEGDLLLYVSDTSVPEEIVLERYMDCSYTIGVANLTADATGHYYFPFAEEDSDDYTYFIDENSDALSLTELSDVTRLYLDKVGGVLLTENNMTDGGTVASLTKGSSYICEFYTGTFYQDFKLTADVRTFVAFERFLGYEYTFLHSNCIAIIFPDYFVSGYYYVNGVGLVRYIAPGDYGKEMDTIDFNDPMILYDENGIVIYDPSNVASDAGLSDEEVESQETEYETAGEEESEEADETASE